MLRRLTVIATMLALGGCSLLVGLSDLGGDGGLPDVKELDAPGDVATDVPTLPDCGHTFCENFDEDGAATFSRWKTPTTNGGLLTLAAGFSPPNAVNASVPPGASNGQGARLTGFDLPSGSKIHIDFEIDNGCFINETDALWLHLVNPLPGMTETAIQLYEGPAHPHVTLTYILDGGTQLDADDWNLSGGNSGWKHYRVDVDFTLSTVQLRDVATSELVTAKIDPAIPPGPTRMEVGLLVADAVPGGCDISLDDILVDVEP